MFSFLAKKINQNKSKLARLSAFVVVFLFIFIAYHPIYAQTASGPDTSHWYNPFSWDVTKDAISSLLATVLYAITSMCALFLWIAGVLFDAVFKYTIVDLSTNIKNLTSINEIWGVFRDLINMSFIFILLYISIGTILRLTTIQTKKMLGNVIIAAILINFSLFFTQVTIDFFNNFAVSIYNKITLTTVGGTGSGSGSTTIATAFVKPLGLDTLLKGATEGKGVLSGASKDIASIMRTSIVASILLIIIGFVLFIISILLIVRYIMFIILMISSPIGVAGGFLPKISEMWGKDWWTNLFDQAIFAPVFMLMLWVTIKIINGMKLSSSVDFSNLTNGDTGVTNTLINFAMVVGMLILSITVAKKSASSGSEGVTGAMGGALTAGSWLGRNTVGRLANRGAERLRGKYQLMTQEQKDSTYGKTLLKRIELNKKIASSSFDVRNSLPKDSRFNPLAQAGIDAKGTGTGGIVKSKADAQAEFNKKKAADNAYLGEMTTNQKEAYTKAANDQINLAKAKELSDRHTEEKEKLEKQRLSAIKDFEAAKKLSENPNISNAAFEKATEIKDKKEKEIKEIDKGLEKLDTDLTTAFKEIKIDVDPTDEESLKAAKEKVADTHKETMEKGGVNAAALSHFEGKSLDELVKIQKEMDKDLKDGNKISRAALNIAGDQSKMAKNAHRLSLYNKRFTFTPGKNKEAAEAIRREEGKSKSEKAAETLIKEAEKKAMADLSENPKTPSAPPTTPAPRTTPPPSPPPTNH